MFKILYVCINMSVGVQVFAHTDTHTYYIIRAMNDVSIGGCA